MTAIIKRMLIASVLCIGFLFMLMPHNAVSSELLFILDCSGSMWGRVDNNQPKIIVAKTALEDLFNEVPDNISMGLLAYGHRKKGDCSDIELVAGMGASVKELSSRITGLTARGKTPIDGSLKLCPGILTSKGQAGTVILISDGIETCGGDPCTTAAALNKSGIQLKVHVIGFQVSGQAESQLKCIADASGGGYFSAGNTEELKSAFQQLKENIVEEKPLPEPPKVAQIETKKSSSKRLKLAGPGTVTLKPASWVSMPPRYWALVDAETGEQVTRASGESTRVKPGEYQLAWRQTEHESTEVTLTATVSVQSSERLDLPFDTGLRITLPSGIAPPRWWALAEPNYDKHVVTFSGPMIAQVVPAGRYTLLWRQDEHRATTVSLGDIDILPGVLNDIALDMGFSLRPAGWVGSSFYYVALKDADGHIIGKWRDLSSHIAPPGEYTVIIRPTEHNNNEIAWSSIRIPDHGFVDIPINSGIKFIHGPDARPPYRVIIIKLDNRDEIIAQNTWDAQPLPPGMYQLDWWEDQHKSKRQTLLDEFEMEAGVVLELEI